MGRLAVWAEQAIFTSMVRRGRGGYHLVSRSKGVDETDAQALARWSPSHGALIYGENNRTSVNFHPLPSGRFALSRTCAGPPEYSGRGGPQLYTHSLIIDDSVLESVGYHAFAIYRDAIALGYFTYQHNPKEVLEPVRLSQLHPRHDVGFWASRARQLDSVNHTFILDRLVSGQPVRYVHDGDRALLAECLIGMLPAQAARRASFATSLVPAMVRPFILSLVSADYR
jgi:hypothetical protein